MKVTECSVSDHFVGKYLDRKASAPTANRRSRSGTELRSGVGGARRGVRECSAVNYHKVELTSRETRTDRFWPWRGGRYEETSNVVVAWTTQSRRALEIHPLHAQRAEEGICMELGDQSTRSTWKSVRRRSDGSDAVERAQLQLKPKLLVGKHGQIG